MKRLLLHLFFFSLLLTSNAQESDKKEQLTLWNRLHIIKPIGSGNSFGLLIENRQYINPWRGHMFLGELNYKHAVNPKHAVGFHTTYLIFTLPHDPFITNTIRKDEIRFHQSLNSRWLDKGKHQLTSRLMLEERLFKTFDGAEAVSGFEYSYTRIRTRLRYKIQLSNRLFGVVSDEFMFQARSDWDFYFDQNRLDLILRYYVLPKIALDIGYLHWYQETSATTFIRHAVRTGLFVKL